jgi:hypothetical protein
MRRTEGWDLPRLVSHTLAVPSQVLATLAAIGVTADTLQTLSRGEWVQIPPSTINLLTQQLAGTDDLVTDAS